MMAAQSSSYWCGNSLRDEWPRQYKESGPAERAEKSAEKKNARDYPLPKKTDIEVATQHFVGMHSNQEYGQESTTIHHGARLAVRGCTTNAQRTEKMNNQFRHPQCFGLHHDLADMFVMPTSKSQI